MFNQRRVISAKNNVPLRSDTEVLLSCKRLSSDRLDEFQGEIAVVQYSIGLTSSKHSLKTVIQTLVW